MGVKLSSKFSFKSEIWVDISSTGCESLKVSLNASLKI